MLAHSDSSRSGLANLESMQDRQAAEQFHLDLLRRVATGEHEALGEMYDQLAGVLFSTAIHILGDKREAEEVVQDVFVQIWTKAGTFDMRLGTPFHWAIGITRNRCIDFIRSRQRRSRLLDEAIEEADSTVENPGPHSHGKPDSEELAAVRNAVQELPEEQKQAISMSFFGGMTHLEIADALKEPLGTVKARIRRGMLKLRETLEDYV